MAEAPPVSTVDGCAFAFSCCPISVGGIFSIRFGTRSSSTLVVLPHKDPDALAEAWEAVSSNGSSSCQSWAFQPLLLLSKQGSSIRAPWRVCTILK
jgi:hypothetical protein